MKNVVFIAPPAAGKGTQSDLLVDKYNYNHISTGDLLREEVSSGSKLGEEIDQLMKTGVLVSDEIVNELLIKALSSDDRPFILDGYPRNEKQIEYLNEILREVNKEIGAVIYLDVDEDLALKRATGRLICPNCNKTYHKYFMKPVKENICDECNAELISRADDTEETFRVRYNNYINNTKPILSYYENNGLLIKIDKTDADEVFEEIEKVVK